MSAARGSCANCQDRRSKAVAGVGTACRVRGGGPGVFRGHAEPGGEMVQGDPDCPVGTGRPGLDAGRFRLLHPHGVAERCTSPGAHPRRTGCARRRAA